MSNQTTSPVVSAFFRSPASFVNGVLIIIGGCGVWYTLDAKVEAMSRDVARLEKRLDETRALHAQVADIKVAIKGVETQLEFVVRQMGGPPPKQP